MCNRAEQAALKVFPDLNREEYFDECFGENYVSPRALLITWIASHLGMTYNEEYGIYKKENDYEY